MYAGGNPTAIKSMKWFSQALMKLMTEMPYKDIAIRMLCREAGLARQTFYNLFEDKERVLQYYLESTAMEQFDRIEGKENLEIRDFVKAFTEYVYHQDQIMKLIAENHLESTLQMAISNSIHRIAVRHASNEQDRYGTAFLSGGLTQIIMCWIYEKERVPVDELMDMIDQIISGNYYRLEVEDCAYSATGIGQQMISSQRI